MQHLVLYAIHGFLYLQAIDFLSAFRVLKVLCLVTYFKPMAVLLRSMRNSFHELVTLFLFVSITAVVFGCLVYYCERYMGHS